MLLHFLISVIINIFFKYFLFCLFFVFTLFHICANKNVSQNSDDF